MAFRPHDRYVQGFVTIGLWASNPVAQAPRIRTKNTRYNGICPPDVGFLTLWTRIKNDSNGIFVIDLFKADILIEHFSSNRENAFVSPLDIEGKAFIVQEAFNVLTKTL